MTVAARPTDAATPPRLCDDAVKPECARWGQERTPVA